MSSLESQSGKIVVAAIDFGTTYSGFAFSFRHEFSKDPCKISSPNWTAASRGLVSHKTPTSILINPQQEFECFGYEAEDRYTSLANENLHHDWYYFRRFKMMLHGKLGVKKDVMVKTHDNKKEMLALTVFSMAIRYLKEFLLRTLNQSSTGVTIKTSDVQWVLTVPAIWNDPAKQFMRKAAKKAGILDEDLLIALEPEAASIFCKHMPVEKGDKSFRSFQTGTKYMVLDCGGGTVDITVHKVCEDNTLQELYKASGGAWGGTQVDEAFKQLIIKIIGNNYYLSFCDKNAADWIDLFREFELKKREFKGEGSKKITIKIPVSLKETFEDESDGETIAEALDQSPYSSKMKWMADKIRIDSSVFTQMFEKATHNIIEHVKKLLKEPEVKGTDNIIMVGGFSESLMLQSRIKEEFPDMTVIIPAEAGLSVLKGAVIFGHLPKTISSRKAKYTYGLKTMLDFRRGMHSEQKKEVVCGKEKCKDIFSRHVQKDDKLELDKAQSEKTYTPVDPEQKEILFEFYTSEEMDPMYVTDNGCQHLGQLKIPLPDTKGGLNRPVKVQLIFGGTELKAKAIEVNTQKETVCKLKFLNND